VILRVLMVTVRQARPIPFKIKKAAAQRAVDSRQAVR